MRLLLAGLRSDRPRATHVRQFASVLPLLCFAFPPVCHAQQVIPVGAPKPITPSIGATPRLSPDITQSPIAASTALTDKDAPRAAPPPEAAAGLAVIYHVTNENPHEDWGKLFPVTVRAHADGQCEIAPDQKFLDHAWLVGCLTTPAKGNVAGTFPAAPPLLSERIQAVNQIFYENGYIDSGVRYEAPTRDGESAHINLIAGILVGSGGARCSLVWPKKNPPAPTRRYVRQRLMEGCRPSRPFNIYVLGRDFARLADDRYPWFHKITVSLLPCARGVVTLTDGEDKDGSSQCSASSSAAKSSLPPVSVERNPAWAMTAGIANNRAPSIGSFRSYANVGYYGIAGVSLDAEVGATNGALDGSGVLSIALNPQFTFVGSGQYNQAEVVDPVLRPLGIKSNSWGSDISLYFGAIRCPISPIYGDTFSLTRRVPANSSGIGECRLAVRLPGDGPVGWSAGRDVTFGLTLSHDVSRTYLLGQPFSFSPGSVDGQAFVTALRGSVDLLERGRAGRNGERGWTLAARLVTSLGLNGSASDIAGLDNPSPHFFSLRGQVGYAYQTGIAHLTLESRLSGQWSQKPLYTSERFSVGGVNSVRGYSESTLLADRALVGSIGLDRNFSLAGKSRPEDSTSDDLSRFRIKAFVDGAIATTLSPLPRNTDRLGSVGGGVAWVPSAAAEFSIEYGRRLTPAYSAPDHSLERQGIHLAITVRPIKLICLLKNAQSSQCSNS